MITQQLYNLKLAHPPDWLPPNIAMEGLHGSMAYGCNEPESDHDVYGFCLPPKYMIFPHLAGEIPGFGRQLKRFEQYEQSHIVDQKKEYDIHIYSIVKFFQLCMENNPNMLDALFLPRECITHSTHIWEMVRDRRKIFLSKKCYWTFTGYAFGQLSNLTKKKPKETSRRFKLIEQFGYDTKYASHIIRLINQCEQLLTEADMDLRRSAEVMRDVRRGNWTQDQIREWFATREPQLKKLYDDSQTLPYQCEEEPIKALLLECLEHHYGSLDKCVILPDRYKTALVDIKEILNKANI